MLSDAELDKLMQEKRKTKHTKVCPICNTTFVTTKSNAKYDKKECERQYNLRYLREYYQKVLRSRRIAKKKKIPLDNPDIS